MLSRGSLLSEIINELPILNREKYKIPIDESSSILMKQCLETYKELENPEYKIREIETGKVISFNDTSGISNVKIKIEKENIIFQFEKDDDNFQLDLDKYFSSDKIDNVRNSILGMKYDLKFIDGIKISWDNGFLLLRLSNTEPVMRLILDYQ